MTRSSCKAVKNFHSNLKVTSVTLEHWRVSKKTLSNFNSGKLLLQPCAFVSLK